MIFITPSKELEQDKELEQQYADLMLIQQDEKEVKCPEPYPYFNVNQNFKKFSLYSELNSETSFETNASF